MICTIPGTLDRCDDATGTNDVSMACMIATDVLLQRLKSSLYSVHVPYLGYRSDVLAWYVQKTNPDDCIAKR